MVATLNSHCHLGTTSPPTADKYTLKFTQQHHRRPSLVASARRALSGQLHFHVLSGTSGPVIFTDYTPTLQLESQSELETVLGLLGKTVYYVPPYHEDVLGVPQSGYIHTMRVRAIQQIESSDALEQYWWVTLDLVDAESKA